MDKRSLRWHDINRVNGHYTFGIAEKAIIPIQKNNTFTLEFEKIYDLTISIKISHHKII